MASQEEAVSVVAPGEEKEEEQEEEKKEDVKKVVRGGEFLVDGPPNHSFNSRFSTDVVSGDVDMAESQVAVAGSVDSAAEAVVSGGIEPSASVDPGPASAEDVVDATEKVESWDLSEAVQEGGANTEETKPNFSEDGTVEDGKAQSSSDLIANAPTSAASGEPVSAPSADVEEKTVELGSQDVGAVCEELPAQVGVSDNGSAQLQDEGSAEKGDREAPETSVDEVHEVGEKSVAPSSAEPDKEVASEQVVPSPSADFEEKSVDVGEKSDGVEATSFANENKSVDVEDKRSDLDTKPDDSEEKSAEVNSEGAGFVKQGLLAEDASTSEEVSPQILDEAAPEKGESNAPEPPAREFNEIAEATTAVEPDEAVESLQGVPPPSADVEEQSVDVEDKSVDVEDKPADVEDKSVDVEDKSVEVEDKSVDVEDKSVDVEGNIVEVNSEDSGVVSKELPAEVLASEEVSPEIPIEESTLRSKIDEPEVLVKDVEEIAETSTSVDPDEVGNRNALPSSFVDEQKTVDKDAGSVVEDFSPKIRDEESAAVEAPDSPVEDEVHEIAEATTSTEPDEDVASSEAVPSSSVDVEEKSNDLDSRDAGDLGEDVIPNTEDEVSGRSGDNEAPLVEDAHQLAEATTSAEPAEEVTSLGEVPSSSVDVEEKSSELGSAHAEARSDVEDKSVQLDVSPEFDTQESGDQGDSELRAPPSEEQGREVPQATTTSEPTDAVASLETVHSPPAEVVEKSVDLGSADASTKIDNEGSSEKVEGEAPEPSVKNVLDGAEETTVEGAADEGASLAEMRSASHDDEEKSFELNSQEARPVSEVAEATNSAEPDEVVANLDALPSSSADVEDKSLQLDVSPEIDTQESAEQGDIEAREAPSAEQGLEVAEATTSSEPTDAVSSLETVHSPPVEVVEKSVDLDSADVGAMSEDASSKIDDEGSAEKVESEAPEPSVTNVLEGADATVREEPSAEVASSDENPSASVGVEEKSFELNSQDAVSEVAEPTSSAEPDEVVANLEGLPSSSADVKEKPVDLDPGSVDENVNTRLEHEGSAEKGDHESTEALVEDAHEVAQATTCAEPAVAVTSEETMPSSSVGVEDKASDLNSADAGALSKNFSPEIESKESAVFVQSEAAGSPVGDVQEDAESPTSTEPAIEAPTVEAEASPSIDVEERSAEVNSDLSEAVSEGVSPTVKEEDSATNVDRESRELPVEDEVHEVAETTTGTDSAEEVASPEALSSPSAELQDRSVDVNFSDEGAKSDDFSSRIQHEELSEGNVKKSPEGPVEEEVHDAAAAETTSSETVPSEQALPSPSVDLEEKSVELDSANAGTVVENARPKIGDDDSAETVGGEAPGPHVDEVRQAAASSASAEPGEDVASLRAVHSPFVDVEERSFEVDPVGPTPSEEAHEESTSVESVPAPAEDVEDKSVQALDSNDPSGTQVPSGSGDKDRISPDSTAEGAGDDVGSAAQFVPNEEVHEVVESTISAEPGDVPVEPESTLAPFDGDEDRSGDGDSADLIDVTSASRSVDPEGVTPEISSEATVSGGGDEKTPSLESVSSPATRVEDCYFEGNPEETRDLKAGLHTESADELDVSPEVPAVDVADKFGSEALFSPVEDVHEVVEATIDPEQEEGLNIPESTSALGDFEEKFEDLRKTLTTVQPLESVDKGLDTRDLPGEEFHAPIEESGKFEDAATVPDSGALDSAAAVSEDIQSISETKSREVNFDDREEALPSSDDVISEKGASTVGEEGSSSDAVASDVSSPPPAVKEESPKSYDLHEVAVNLEDAAGKTLADGNSSIAGDRQASVAENVAHIVLDESSKTGDSSELISGVIQHVAELAQDDFQSDPNVLPDTVNQVFDSEATSTPANEASGPKESTSLGTKFSLFVIWCISLCASHVSSKDMPAPALKLGAEEVAAVLHSNSQGAASSRAASSV